MEKLNYKSENNMQNNQFLKVKNSLLELKKDLLEF